MKRVSRMIAALAAMLCFFVAPAFAEAAEIEEQPASSVRIEIKQGNGAAASSLTTMSSQPGSSLRAQEAATDEDSANSAANNSTVANDSTSGLTTDSAASNQGGSTTSDKNDLADAGAKPSTPPASAPVQTKPAPKSTFEKVDGVWVYYNAAGKGTKVTQLTPGWVKRENVWYWFPNNDSFVSNGFVQVSGVKYHFDALGHMQTQWFKANDKRYYANSSGAVQKGWLKQGRYWYYLDSSGARVEKDWRCVRNAWYYFFDNGRMATGWFKDNKNTRWYYSNGSGAMQTGWLKQGRTWYHLNSSGVMAEKVWRKIRGVWYYFYSSGRMATGWFKDSKNTSWYYANGSGAMQTGWIHPGGAWYYMEASGAMHEGWAYLGGIWYYLRPKSGAMVTGRVKIDGRTERFDGNGHYRPGLNRSVLISAINSATGARTVKVSGGSIPKEALARIQADIADIEAQGGSCGIVLVDLTSGAVISSNAWKSYYAASSIKGSYVCAIASSDPGRAGQYGGTISNTISWSSNSDYKALRAAFGGQPMATYMSQAGVSSFSPYSTWVDMSAADQAKLWVRNYDYLSESKGASTWVGSKYHHTAMSFIDKALGGKYNVSSKAGWIWNGRGSRYHVYDDGGFVEKGDKPYVLAVMSSANSTDQGRLAKLVRDLDSAHSKLKRK